MGTSPLSPPQSRPEFQNNLFTTELTPTVYAYLTGAGNQNTENVFSLTGNINPGYGSPYPSSPLNYSLMPTSPAIALSQSIPTLVEVGPYPVVYAGTAAGSPAGACVSAWIAGANISGFTSPFGLCN